MLFSTSKDFKNFVNGKANDKARCPAFRYSHSAWKRLPALILTIALAGPHHFLSCSAALFIVAAEFEIALRFLMMLNSGWKRRISRRCCFAMLSYGVVLY